MKKSKTVEFIPASGINKGVFDPPIPALKLIPEWYKNQSRYTGGTKTIMQNFGIPNHTVKACMPVFDMMTAGYFITLPADLYIDRNENGESSFIWATNEVKLIEHHDQTQYDSFSIPPEFESLGYKFINSWITKTPKGYSSIFMQPALRDDLPFYTLSAIVDTDEHPIPVNFPFFIRKDFKGLIKMGTPIVQIIPFKRESWTINIQDDYDYSFDTKWKKAERKIGNRYKTFFRSEKRWF